MPRGNTIKKVWGGFCCGRLAAQFVDDRFGAQMHFRKVPALFLTRAEARQQFEDVRPVTLVWEKRKS